MSGVDFLMRVHYRFFMTNPRFWYSKDLITADQIICVLASNLRAEPAPKEKS
jgi:hypothetical protein